MYDDQIKLEWEHKAIGRENQGKEPRGNKTIRFNQYLKHHYNPFGQHSKKFRPFNNYSKTLKSGQEWR